MPVWRQKLREARLSNRTWVRVTALLTVAIVGLYEGFWKLGTRDWYHDEVRYLNVARAYLEGDFSNRQDLESYVHPPFGKYLFAVGEAILGFSPGDSRVVSALIGVGIGLVLFVFARHVAGFWAGLVAAGLWVLVPHPARASENIRGIGKGIAGVGGYDVGRTILWFSLTHTHRTAQPTRPRRHGSGVEAAVPPPTPFRVVGLRRGWDSRARSHPAAHGTMRERRIVPRESVPSVAQSCEATAARSVRA